MIEHDDGQQRADDQADTRDLLNQVDFGLECRQFLTSKIGRYVAERAQSAMFEACTALAQVEPTDQAAIIRLQQQHHVAAAALSWIAQAVEAGVQAEQTYITREQGE